MDVVDESVKKSQSNGILSIKNSACDPYPYKAEYFDIVTCIDVLEHLTETDTKKAVKEIYRVLKKNSYSLLAPALTKDLTGYLHLTVRKKEWWITLFEDEGFTFVEYINPKGILIKK
jgi:ubiquinone/menaquinone biosynthesis C-methylase UbiE